MDSFFENVKILFFFFKFSHCFCARAWIFMSWWGSRGLHSKISVCLFVSLPICASVWLSSMTVRLAALPFFPPSIILLVDSCHMCLKQSFSSSGFCCLSPSVPELVSCLCACAWPFTCRLIGCVRVCVCACFLANLCVCMRLPRAHLSVRRLSTEY